MDRGKRDRIYRESELVEFVKSRIDIADLIRLVYARHDRLTALFKHDRNVPVVRDKSAAYIAHKKNDVRRIYGDLRLLLHFAQDDIVGLGLDSSGIDNYELSAAPLGLSVDAVSCNSGDVLDDRTPLAYKLIEKRAFAHVRASHYC